MNVVRWTCNSITILMLEIEKTLYCPSTLLALVLGISHRTLCRIAQTNAHKLHPLRYYNIAPKTQALLAEHKDEFRIQRLKKDLILYPERDMIRLASRSRTEIGEDFQEQLIDLIIERATKERLTREEVKQDLEQQRVAIVQMCQGELTEMRERLAALEEVTKILLPSTANLLSHAGSSLNIGRKLKAVGNN